MPHSQRGSIMSKRAVLYARVSSDDRTKTGGANLQAQLDLCQEHAQRQGYVVVAELAEDDRGASGAAFDLPQLSTALDMARNSQFDVLIARELDRLSRDLAKQLIVEQELKRNKVTIEYAMYDFPDTPEGRLNKHIRAMLAEYEREKIAQRMKRGKVREIKAGNEGANGMAPYGYVIERNEKGDAHFAVNEEEAQVVRRIFTWYADGDAGRPISTRKIAERLTKLGMPRPRSTRTEWTHSTVTTILRNPAYMGIWHFGKTRIEGDQRVANPRENWITLEITPIIDRNTWNRAQERFVSNKKLAHNRVKNDYLLSGCVTCKVCGFAYNGNTHTQRWNGRTTQYSYYRHSCDAPSKTCRGYFRVENVDLAVWNWLCSKFQDEAALLTAIEEAQVERDKQLQPRRQELDSTATLISRNERSLARVKKLYYDGHLTEEEYLQDSTPYLEALAGLERERARLESLIQVQELTDEAKHTIIELAQYVQKGIARAQDDFPEQRRLIEMLQVHCELEDKNGEKRVHISCVAGEGVVRCDQSVCTS